MKYYYRVWRFEDGQKTTEYTQYMLAPFFHEDALNHTMRTGEVILDAMPISTKKAFPPKTKIRVERYLTADFTDQPNKTWDFIVDADRVEEYAGCPEVCCHRIDLIDPSTAAQGMHPDNIALTYELQDATLNYKTTTISTTKVAVQAPPNGHAAAIRQTDGFSWELTNNVIITT